MTTILVIEDEPDICEAITDWLTFEGYNTLQAIDGKAGIELAKKHIPDLIISDISMPDTDGYRVLGELRTHPPTSLIPVIFLTARTRRTDIRQAMELGAEDYITKPFTDEELLAAVKAQLRKAAKLQQHTQRQLDELRLTLTYTLPHELRTPLASILGFGQLLMMDTHKLPAKQIEEMAETIFKSGQRLHRLVENYLLYSQIELSAIDPIESTVYQTDRFKYPNQAINRVCRKVSHKYDRMADLNLEVNDECMVRVNEVNLEKIVSELVDNAFKFSEAGKPVEVSVQLGEQVYQIEVVDYGRGMNEDDIIRIGGYRQFGRTVYEQQGVGLGLIIAKRLTELYGGTLSIQSIPQEQTTVTVKLICTE